MKIRLLGTELFYTDGQTDGQMDRHDSDIRSFAKAPKNYSWCSYCFYVFCTDLRAYSDFIQH